MVEPIVNNSFCRFIPRTFTFSIIRRFDFQFMHVRTVLFKSGARFRATRNNVARVVNRFPIFLSFAPSNFLISFYKLQLVIQFRI